MTMVQTMNLTHEKRIEAENINCNDGKSLYKFMNNEKWNQYKTSKQRKRLFEIYSKTKLYATQNI